MWVENVEISLTPDDNMACIAKRSSLQGINAEGIATVGQRLTLKAGNQILLWDKKVGVPTVVTITRLGGRRGKRFPLG